MGRVMDAQAIAVEVSEDLVNSVGKLLRGTLAGLSDASAWR